MNKALVSWSGGKDSCYALYMASRLQIKPVVLLNVLNEEGCISRSHGIPAPVLAAQAASMNLPLHLVAASWQDYEKTFTGALQELKEKHHLSHAVFGDIDLEEHRQWEEKVCNNAGLHPVLPLWKGDRKALVFEMLSWGLMTIIVSCNAIMGPDYLGRILTPALIHELETLGIDPCGENGEFHTLVIDCPLFTAPLSVVTGEAKLHHDYWFATFIVQP